MLPSALVEQLEEGMGDFLRASFWSSTPAFRHLVDHFIARPGQLFKGPYFSLQLPFKTGTGGSGFDAVPLAFPPYAHQEAAFERLRRGEKTLVATGTGSGKTECFLVPLLAHCAERRGEGGIKAIILYPMNALAADQATRIAKFIDGTPSLEGIRAGMYVGSQGRNPSTVMTRDSVITDRDTLRNDPPDILLTNYKMLDYLLLRPEDQPLWKDNGIETLEYLIVDELHTFDGAQGTDLACLIRRLKARLHTPEDHLTCVGTSATLGGGAGIDDLVTYATQIFGEPFETKSIITETRQSAGEFLGFEALEETDPPGIEHAQTMDPRQYIDEDKYLEAQVRVWFEPYLDEVMPGGVLDAVELGEKLRAFHFVRRVLGQIRDGSIELDELASRLFKSEWSESEARRDYARLCITSLFALFSAARSKLEETEQARKAREDRGEPQPVRPFLQVRVQLWQREMRRMLASVGEVPELVYADDLTAEQAQRHLPVIYCRECGGMGWAALVHKDRKSNITTDRSAFYQAFFADDSRVEYFYPKEGGPLQGMRRWLHTDSLSLTSSQPDNPDEFIEVVQPPSVTLSSGRQKLDRDCPCCGAGNTVSLLGFQAATLTSIFINQLFASRFNDDKRLLTFSDSVQDAAHRAGFFGARTWNFNTRMAIQQALDAFSTSRLEAGAPPPSLSLLADEVAEHWREQLGDDETFAGIFTPWNMQWMGEYRELTEKGRLGSNGESFVGKIARRMSWEVYNEFTLRSRVGRSLQRSGAAAAYLEPQKRAEAVSKLTTILQNEYGPLKEVSEEIVERIVHGFAHRMLVRGAVLHDVLPETYLATGGINTYAFKKAHHLPDYGPQSHLPRLVSTARTRRFEARIGSATTSSWYQIWVERMTEEIAPLLKNLSASVVETIFDTLTDLKVLGKREGQTPVWGLSPDVVHVSNELVCIECDTTRERFWVARDELDVWLGMPNLSTHAVGKYREVESAPEPFYRPLYKTGTVSRINAEEHTGLLARARREEVEERFKSENPAVWDPNLLSCTPTLEMGIDIGDLSSSILCSVPPSVSSFVQRIGRAGRRDGNSLILTIANAKPHDLYFFSNTDEMVDGDVETPGVFLNASAVLERQLTAYCLDRWIATGVNRKAFPRRLGEVFGTLEKTDKVDRFPHNFRERLQAHETEWLGGFLGLFTDELSDDTRERLTDFFRGKDHSGGLAVTVHNGLIQQKKDRGNRKRDLDQVRTKLKKLESQKVMSDAEDELRGDLIKEERALSALIRQLDGRDLLQFFTDEGLIPNYAFPEAGVSLKSIIWRKKTKGSDDDGDEFEDLSYEYERPARSAIVELAPNNTFYAGGRQVDIDQIDIKGSKVEPWRFCPNCSFCTDVLAGDEATACPVCKSPHWGDVGQRRDMLKLRQVFARTGDRDSRIDDQSDRRTPSYYNRKMLAIFHEDTASDAWSLPESTTPFGFEYFKQATFREINFGEEEIGENLSVAGEAAVRNGFEICTECGKVQPKTKFKHAAYCKYRGDEEGGTFISCLYLYREFRSEAVRLLLPFIDDIDHAKKRNSFLAAFEMGLREYFGGRVDHLQSTMHSEPVEDSVGRKQFLVVYDSVPGGTGYLKELVSDEQRIFDIMQVALDRLRSCTCHHDPEKDGCYRCLFAYRHSYEMDDISRDLATEELTKLVERRELIESVGSLGQVSVSALVDSILELRVLEGLRSRASDVGAKFKHVMVRGKPGYRIEFEDHAWSVEQQVELTSRDGVVAYSKADFVLRLEGSDKVRPIAVYSDGFKYHEGRLAKDFMQRMALSHSGRYRFWSVTWNDVLETGKTAFDVVGFELQQSTKDATFENLGKGSVAQSLLTKSKLDMLFEHLRLADERYFRQLAMGVVWGPILSSQLLHPTARDEWIGQLGEFARPELVDAMSRDMDKQWLVGGSALAPDGFVHRVFVAGPQISMSNQSPIDTRALVYLDDEPTQRDRKEFVGLWEGTLWTMNVLQFTDELYAVTTMEQGDLDLDALLSQATRPDLTTGETADDFAWDEAREALLEPNYVRLAETLQSLGLAAPTGGYSLTDERGHSLGAMAEMAWPAQKVAILASPGDDFFEPGWREEFESAGWTVVETNEAIEDAERIKQLVEEA